VRNLRTLLGSDVEILAYRVRRDSPTLTDTLEVVPGEDLEQRYDVEVYDDLDVALGEAPDAVLICNPSSLHLPVALKAARAGCALFIEKPLSNNLEGVNDLVKYVETHGIVGLVGYQLRFHPSLRRTQELLRAGAIGQVVAVRIEIGEYLPGWHRYEDYRQMYASRADLGGGVILSQIHELDYIYWLFGMPTRVFALGGHLTHLEVDVEDTASILFECSIDGRAIPVHVHQDYIQRPPSRTCEVIGDAGKILVDLRQLTLTAFDAEGNVTESSSNPDFQRNELFLDEMKHFLACLDGRESPSVTIRDGARSLMMALGAKQSIETGQVVDLTRQAI
jgi:predicted dehydrogenase